MALPVTLQKIRAEKPLTPSVFLCDASLLSGLEGWVEFFVACEKMGGGLGTETARKRLLQARAC